VEIAKSGQNSMKMSNMEDREKLIQEIWSYCKNTHNSADYEHLQTFNVKKLQEILTDIKESNE
tara:strand:+ start:364 stop:552 length:189 start_codon:yes stop_codon:yes gene_type:complete